MQQPSIEQLKNMAVELRQTALTMIYEAQSGHPGDLFRQPTLSQLYILRK